MTELTALANRLEALAVAYPDGIPADELAIEVRRVRALAEMMGEGLAGEA